MRRPAPPVPVQSMAAELGRRGGLVTSERKAAAARRNGAKGGRPRSRLSEAPATGAKWLTLAERKAQLRERLADGLARLKTELARYGAEHGGDFILFGSAARGDFTFDSDVDILLRFPQREERRAWRYAEDACRRLRLLPDIRPATLCDADFLRQALRHGEVLRG